MTIEGSHKTFTIEFDFFLNFLATQHGIFYIDSTESYPLDHQKSLLEFDFLVANVVGIVWNKGYFSFCTFFHCLTFSFFFFFTLDMYYL